MIATPRWLPDLQYPRWKQWYNTKTWLSPVVTHLEAHLPKSGRNLIELNFANRPWLTGNPAPARATTEDFILEHPYYMLSGTTTTLDSLVGPDMYNMPLKMDRDIRNMDLSYAVGNNDLMFRCLAFKHVFTFVNYNKHALEIYYQVGPTGTPFENLAALGTPHLDMEGAPAMKFTVPGVLDTGDKGVKKSLILAEKMSDIFPLAYQQRAGVSGSTAGTASSSGTPWVSVNSSLTDSNYATMPPHQAAGTTSTGTQVALPPSLKVRFNHKLQVPFGIAAAATTDTNALGEFTGTGFHLHVDSSWLVDIVNITGAHVGHPGEKAYPSQVA